MVTSRKLSSKDETPTIEQKKYRYMIGNLQYLTHSKPDIANVVGIVARFQANPIEYQYVVVKRIFRYLKGTPDYGIWYDRCNDFIHCAYTNADWVGSMDDRKITSGGALLLEEDCFLGSERNKTIFHRVLLRQSMLQQQIIVTKLCG